MKNVLAFIVGFGFCSSSVAGPISLYSPSRGVKDQGIMLKSWGSGTIKETDEEGFSGTFSVRVSSRNYFQGGRLLMDTPSDLTSVYGDKNNLLMLVLKIPDSGSSAGGVAPGKGGGKGGAPIGGPGMGGGAPGIPTRGGRGGSGGSAGRAGGQVGGGAGVGMPPGMGGRAGAGGQAGSTGSPGTPAPLRNIRVIVTTTDGLRSEAYVPVNTAGAGEKGWRRIGLPLQAISGFDRTNKIVKEIAFAGDAASTFYVGELEILNDSTPISGEPNVRELNLALGDEVEFTGYGYGGSSILKYTWDFDDKDGIQVDAEGQSIKRRFRKPGTFTITLTISDAYGLKKPFSTTIKAEVNP